MSANNSPPSPYDFGTPTKLRGEPKTLLLTVSSALPTPARSLPRNKCAVFTFLGMSTPSGGPTAWARDVHAGALGLASSCS